MSLLLIFSLSNCLSLISFIIIKLCFFLYFFLDKYYTLLQKLQASCLVIIEQFFFSKIFFNCKRNREKKNNFLEKLTINRNERKYIKLEIIN